VNGWAPGWENPGCALAMRNGGAFLARDPIHFPPEGEMVRRYFHFDEKFNAFNR